jgi:hypothetical protein
LTVLEEEALGKGIIWIMPKYYCWESLMLSCEKLLEICSFGVTVAQDEPIRMQFEELHRVIFALQRVNASVEIPISTYERLLPSGQDNVEHYMKALVADVTRIGGKHNLLLTRRKIGICWTVDCYCKKHPKLPNECNRCYMLRHNLLFKVSKLRVLVDNSLVPKYFKCCMS